MAHNLAPSVNCSLDDIDLNALKVIYTRPSHPNSKIGIIIYHYWSVKFGIFKPLREKVGFLPCLCSKPEARKLLGGVRGLSVRQTISIA